MMSGPPNLPQLMLPGRHSVCANWWISSSTDVRIPGTLQRAVCEETQSTVGSAAAEMAQVDHRVGQGLEGIVHGTDDLVANKHATKLVLPREHAFDGAKALLEDGRTEQAFGSALGGFPGARVLVDVGNPVAVEDRFAVGLAIVDAIETDDATSKIDANGLGDACQLRQRLTQQRALIAVARCRYEWRDHVAVAIAKRDGLVALDVFVPAKAKVVAALLGDGCGAVAVNDRGVEQIAFEKSQYRTREDGVEAAVGHPATKGPVDARVVDFDSPHAARLNRQRLP